MTRVLTIRVQWCKALQRLDARALHTACWRNGWCDDGLGLYSSRKIWQREPRTGRCVLSAGQAAARREEGPDPVGII